MTLDALYMPMPAGRRGASKTPLGGWDLTPAEEAQERRRAAWRKYAANNPDKRRAAVRAWKERQKALKAVA